MASARVEHVLDEIIHLTPEERADLLGALPAILQSTRQGDGRVTSVFLAQADALRVRIGARMRAAGIAPGSIADDLDAVRGQRLDDLTREAARA